MVHECAAQTSVCTKRLIDKHGAPSSDGENLLNTVTYQPVSNLLRNFFHLYATI